MELLNFEAIEIGKAGALIIFIVITLLIFNRKGLLPVTITEKGEAVIMAILTTASMIGLTLIGIKTGQSISTIAITIIFIVVFTIIISDIIAK